MVAVPLTGKDYAKGVLFGLATMIVSLIATAVILATRAGDHPARNSGRATLPADPDFNFRRWLLLVPPALGSTQGIRQAAVHGRRRCEERSRRVHSRPPLPDCLHDCDLVCVCSKDSRVDRDRCPSSGLLAGDAGHILRGLLLRVSTSIPALFAVAVGQDDILRAGWQPALAPVCTQAGGFSTRRRLPTCRIKKEMLGFFAGYWPT